MSTESCKGNFIPPHEREDLRYGDPHNPRGKHKFYGPDATEFPSGKRRPLESHGFYLADEAETRGFFRRVRDLFRVS